MSNPVGIRQVTTVSHPRRFKKDHVFTWPAMKAAEGRWEEQKVTLKQAPWSACPPAMVRDFVQALSEDLQAHLGDEARSRAMMGLAMTIADSPTPAATIGVSWGPARLDIVFRAMPLAPDQDPSLELTADIPLNDTDIRQACAEGNFTTPGPRLPFDPVGQLSDDALMGLVRQVEAIEQGPDSGVLMGVTGVLMEWAYASARNAECLTSVWSGLTMGTRKVLPGQQMEMVLRQRDWEHALQPQSEEPALEPVTRATVRIPRH